MTKKNTGRGRQNESRGGDRHVGPPGGSGGDRRGSSGGDWRGGSGGDRRGGSGGNRRGVSGGGSRRGQGNSCHFRGSNSLGSRGGNNSRQDNSRGGNHRDSGGGQHYNQYNERYDGNGGNGNRIVYDDIGDPAQDNAYANDGNQLRTARGDMEDTGFTKFKDPRRIEQSHQQQYQRVKLDYRQFALHVENSLSQQPEMAATAPNAATPPVVAPTVTAANATAPAPVPVVSAPPFTQEVVAAAVRDMKKEAVVAATNPKVKPEPTSPKPSSSSSSESSSSEEDEPPIPLKPVAAPVAVVKPAHTRPTSSSSSSSSSSSEEEAAPKNDAKPTAKPGLAPMGATNNSEEDVICLGNLEKKYSINDDDDEDDDDDAATASKTQFDASKEAEASRAKAAQELTEQCMICDQVGHTSFHCQMICANCSAPYHNLKSCPKPPNLAIMMQHFMEFCMQQMNNFKPNDTFTLPSNFYATTPAAYTPMPFVSTPLSATSKAKSKSKPVKTAKNAPKKKSNPKKAKKRTRLDSSESETDSDGDADEPKKKPSSRKVKKKPFVSSSETDSDEDDDQVENGNQKETTSSSATESDASEHLAAAKPKKKKPKLHDEHLRPIYPALPAFMPPTAAAFNPMMFGQMFPNAFPGINYNR